MTHDNLHTHDELQSQGSVSTEEPSSMGGSRRMREIQSNQLTAYIKGAEPAAEADGAASALGVEDLAQGIAADEAERHGLEESVRADLAEFLLRTWEVADRHRRHWNNNWRRYLDRTWPYSDLLSYTPEQVQSDWAAMTAFGAITTALGLIPGPVGAAASVTGFLVSAIHSAIEGSRAGSEQARLVRDSGREAMDALWQSIELSEVGYNAARETAQAQVDELSGAEGYGGQTADELRALRLRVAAATNAVDAVGTVVDPNDTSYSTELILAWLRAHAEHGDDPGPSLESLDGGEERWDALRDYHVAPSDETLGTRRMYVEQVRYELTRRGLPSEPVLEALEQESPEQLGRHGFGWALSQPFSFRATELSGYRIANAFTAEELWDDLDIREWMYPISSIGPRIRQRFGLWLEENNATLELGITIVFDDGSARVRRFAYSIPELDAFNDEENELVHDLTD